MNFLIAPDSFKESMSALQAAKAIERGIRQVLPESLCEIAPMADGGEGTAACLMYGTDAEEIVCRVTGPVGEPVDARIYWFESRKTALIEVAEACGIMLIPTDLRDPTTATSYGVGEMIEHVLQLGPSEIILTLGGTGTNDGGAGMLQALGAKILDKMGRDILPGNLPLKEIHTLDVSEPIRKLRGIKVTVLCDVKMPLLGSNGATHVFAPQKGAKEQDIPRLEQAMAHYAAVMEQTASKKITYREGSGAAGGIGFALFAISDAECVSGCNYVIEALGMEEKIQACDYVITGEGSIDSQSLAGKVPIGIATVAKKYNKPVIVFTGKIGKNTAEFYQNGVTAAFSILRKLEPLEDALQNGEYNLQASAENFARVIKQEREKSYEQ